MSKSKNTNALKKAIERNHKEAGKTKINGVNAFEKAINKNRKAAGFEQKTAGFSLEQKHQNEEE